MRPVGRSAPRRAKEGCAPEGCGAIEVPGAKDDGKWGVRGRNKWGVMGI